MLGVGASEAPSICGVGRSTPLEVYLRKLGLAPPVEENEAMRVGKALEPAIADLYQQRTGVPLLRRQVFAYRPLAPRIFATLDAIRPDDRPVEFKAVGLRMARDWGDEADGPEGVPSYVIVQAIHQMIASGAGEVDVAALIGTELRIYTVPRVASVVAWVANQVGSFLDRLDRLDPPPPTLDGERDDSRLLAYLHPEAEGAMDLDGPDAEAGASYIDLGGEIKALEGRRDEARARVLAAMGGRSLATLPDGRRLSRRVVETPERTQVVKAKTYAALSEKKGGK